MARATSFWKDRRGSLQETTALIAAVICLLGVGAAMGLDRLTRNGHLPRIAIVLHDDGFARKIKDLPSSTIQTASEPQLDDTPVGTIPGESSRPIVINPCDGSRN